MSTLVPLGGVVDEPTCLKLPDTSVNDVLALTAGTDGIRYVHGLIIANAGGSAREVSVWLTKDTTDHLIFVRSVPAKDTVTEALAYPLRLYAKDKARKIRAQAAAADEVTITLITSSASQTGLAR